VDALEGKRACGIHNRPTANAAIRLGSLSAATIQAAIYGPTLSNVNLFSNV